MIWLDRATPTMVRTGQRQARPHAVVLGRRDPVLPDHQGPVRPGAAPGDGHGPLGALGLVERECVTEFSR